MRVKRWVWFQKRQNLLPGISKTTCDAAYVVRQILHHLLRATCSLITKNHRRRYNLKSEQVVLPDPWWLNPREEADFGGLLCRKHCGCKPDGCGRVVTDFALAVTVDRNWMVLFLTSRTFPVATSFHKDFAVETSFETSRFSIPEGRLTDKQRSKIIWD